MKPLRRHLFAAMSAAAVLLVPLLSPASGESALPPGSAARVSEILAWTNEIYTRVAVYTGEEVAWRVDTLRADPKRGLPPRIFVDLPGAGIRDEILHKPVEVRNGLLRQVRAGRFSRDVVRVVIDLERESTYRVFALDNPFRIVIDIDGEGEIPVPRADTASARPVPAGPAAEAPAPAAASPDSGAGFPSPAAPPAAPAAEARAERDAPGSPPPPRGVTGSG